MLNILEVQDKEQIGIALGKERDKKGLSKYHFQKEGLRQEALNSIEEGSKNYSIDSLIKYISILNAEE